METHNSKHYGVPICSSLPCKRLATSAVYLCFRLNGLRVNISVHWWVGLVSADIVDSESVSRPLAVPCENLGSEVLSVECVSRSNILTHKGVLFWGRASSGRCFRRGPSNKMCTHRFPPSVRTVVATWNVCVSSDAYGPECVRINAIIAISFIHSLFSQA